MMAKLFGIVRPQAVWAVVWDGDNIAGIKHNFGPDMAPYFFVNEEHGNLCYGLDVEQSNQYELGTLITNLGGLMGMSQESWDMQYSTVDSATRLKYDVTEDAQTVASFTAKRS